MVINVTAVVYAIPIVALAVVVVRLARRPAVRTRDPIPGIVIMVLGFAVCVFMYGYADADRRTYTADPTCTAAFGYVPHRGGACRLSSAYVDRWYWSGGRNRRRHMVLRTADGAERDVTYGGDVRASVWHGLYDTADRNATVQFFNDDIVMVETRSGLATTTAQPQNRAETWMLCGVAAGIAGTIAALGASRNRLLSRPSA